MDSNKNLDTMRNQLHWLEKLAEDPAYLYLNGLIQDQMDNLQRHLFTPLKSLDSAGEQEYNKGSLEGRCAWESVRKTQIEVLESEIKREQEKLNAEDRDTTEKPTNPDGSPVGGSTEPTDTRAP